MRDDDRNDDQDSAEQARVVLHLVPTYTRSYPEASRRAFEGDCCATLLSL